MNNIALRKMIKYIKKMLYDYFISIAIKNIDFVAYHLNQQIIYGTYPEKSFISTRINIAQSLAELQIEFACLFK